MSTSIVHTAQMARIVRMPSKSNGCGKQLQTRSRCPAHPEQAESGDRFGTSGIGEAVIAPARIPLAIVAQTEGGSSPER